MENVNYRIRVRGHLNEEWRGWFQGMSISLEHNGITRLTGPLEDQAALFGVLKRIRNLGLALISIEQI